MWQFEHKANAKGFKIIAGVDEAGRGPLAGPVVSAAVILPQDFSCTGINDSKKLSEKKTVCSLSFDQGTGACRCYWCILTPGD